MQRLNKLSFLFFFVFLACSSGKGPGEKAAIQRTGFPEQYLLGGDSVQQFDSTALFRFIDTVKTASRYKEDIRDFYQRRNYTFAWFTGDTLTSSVYTFYNLLHWLWDTGRDSLAYNPVLDSLLMNTGNAPGNFPGLQEKLKTEFLLTNQFFDYARYQYEGRVRSDLRSLDWFIPRGRKNYQMLLDSLVAGVPDLTPTEPVNRQYKLLKKFLVQYNEIRQRDSVTLLYNGKKIADGDSSLFIQQLRTKLVLRGDLSSKDSAGFVMDASLHEAIRSYQQRMGHTVTGKVDRELVKHLNESVLSQIRTILVNMERLRWVPDELQGEYILVNIPDYRLYVNRDTNLLFSMNVVVGKEATQTVIFNGSLSTIVFSPYWNVPQSILVNEMLPLLKRNPHYLSHKDYEVLKDGKQIDPSSVNWSQYHESVPYQVRQKPGAANSLGHIKFLFPNQFSIYLHDTPSRHLFKEEGRSFSHGCIRIAEPVKLAEFLLSGDQEWSRDAIEDAMYSGNEKHVKLKKKVPVFIGYFTAWVDRNGKLNLRDDIYGHDRRLELELFGRPSI